MLVDNWYVFIIFTKLITKFFLFLFFASLFLIAMGRIHLDKGSIPLGDFISKVYIR